MSTQFESPPPLFSPIMDEASLRCPPDPYNPPIRTIEDWKEGDALWYREKEAMYILTAQMMHARGYSSRQYKTAVMIARSFSDHEIASTLRQTEKDAGINVDDVKATTKSLPGGPSRFGAVHQVVRTGVQQLIVRSLAHLSPEESNTALIAQSQDILTQRLQNRVDISFNLTPREIEISLLAMDGLTAGAISDQTGITEGVASDHIARIYTKARCHSRIELIHRLYGAA